MYPMALPASRWRQPRRAAGSPQPQAHPFPDRRRPLAGLSAAVAVATQEHVSGYATRGWSRPEKAAPDRSVTPFCASSFSLSLLHHSIVCLASASWVLAQFHFWHRASKAASPASILLNFCCTVRVCNHSILVSPIPHAVAAIT